MTTTVDNHPMAHRPDLIPPVKVTDELGRGVFVAGAGIYYGDVDNPVTNTPTLNVRTYSSTDLGPIVKLDRPAMLALLRLIAETLAVEP